MRFNTKKRKLSLTWEQQVKNKLDLEKKENKLPEDLINTSVYKTPKILFDSGFVSVPERIGNLVTKPAFADTTRTSAISGEPIAIRIDYNFSQQLNLAPHLIPFIKPIVMIKAPPNATIEMTQVNRRIRYDSRRFARITGDGGLVYQGYKSGTEIQFSEDELDNGDFLVSHTSKWFAGEIQWTDGGDTFSIPQGLLIRAQAYKNISSNAFGSKDWDLFDTSTFDDLSGNTVTGQGTNLNSEQMDDGGGGSFQELTTTKCVDSSVTLFLDITHVTVRGSLFKNGSFESFGDNLIKTSGSLAGDPSIGVNPPFIGGGTAVITTFNFDFNDTYKLHYTTRRIRQLNFSSLGLFDLRNLPEKDDCDTDPRIITKFRVEVNPEGFPIVVIDIIGSPSFVPLDEFNGDVDTIDAVIDTPGQDFVWSKEPPNTQESFRFKLIGSVLLEGKSTIPVPLLVDFVDETYSQTSTGYDKDEENREDKEITQYKAALDESQIRVQMVVTQPFYAHEIKRFEEENR